MAEFCKDCFEKLNGKRYNLALSRDLELCEDCGEMKRVVVGIDGGIDFDIGDLFSGAGERIRNIFRQKRRENDG